MTKQFETPTELDDETLDEVSGGPHFKTWDDVIYAPATGTLETRRSGGEVKVVALNVLN
jgi:hypothetical protein